MRDRVTDKFTEMIIDQNIDKILDKNTDKNTDKSKYKSTAGVYIHIPFCVRKCLYCDFVSVKADDETIDRYVETIISEIHSTKINDKIDSIFIGGGTPSLLSPKQLERILSEINHEDDCEISMECNPGTLTGENLIGYAKAGVNRLSIGLQSASDEELKTLGRIHEFKDFIASYEMARQAGFDNINVDIISAVPGQTIESYKDTLNKVILLNPEHISAYSLIIEEGTPFYGLYGDGEGLPDEDDDREMYHLTKEILKKNGYGRYEISNYAKSGYECRHNLKYWRRDNYYGFGAAAASMVDDVRYKNTDDINMYIKSKGKPELVREDIEKLGNIDCLEEYIMLGLRTIKGVSIDFLENKYDIDFVEKYKDVIAKYLKMEMIEIGKASDENERWLRLTDKGLDVSNVIMADFMSDGD